MGIIDSKKAYKAPCAKVIKANAKSVICQSTDSGAVTIDGYIEENLDW